MKISDLQQLLAKQDPDAEVMVSVDTMLSRSDPRPGTLSLPTRALDTGTFQSGEMLGRPWVSIVASDAWGISPSVGTCPECGEGPGHAFGCGTRSCLRCGRFHHPHCGRGDGQSESSKGEVTPSPAIGTSASRSEVPSGVGSLAPEAPVLSAIRSSEADAEFLFDTEVVVRVKVQAPVAVQFFCGRDVLGTTPESMRTAHNK